MEDTKTATQLTALTVHTYIHTYMMDHNTVKATSNQVHNGLKERTGQTHLTCVLDIKNNIKHIKNANTICLSGRTLKFN